MYLGNTATHIPLVNGHPLWWHLLDPNTIFILLHSCSSRLQSDSLGAVPPPPSPLPLMTGKNSVGFHGQCYLSGIGTYTEPLLQSSLLLWLPGSLSSEKWSVVPQTPNFACVSPGSHLVFSSHLEQLHNAPSHFLSFTSTQRFFSLLSTDVRKLLRCYKNLKSKTIKYLSSDYYESGTKPFAT